MCETAKNVSTVAEVITEKLKADYYVLVATTEQTKHISDMLPFIIIGAHRYLI